MAEPIVTFAPDELPRWTLDRMKLFIETLRRTGNVSAAARSVGMSRRAAYRLRAKLEGHPFARAWDAAMVQRLVVGRMIGDHAARLTGSQEVTPRHTPSQVVTPGNRGSQIS